jgi:hypothetical protein
VGLKGGPVGLRGGCVGLRGVSGRFQGHLCGFAGRVTPAAVLRRRPAAFPILRIDGAEAANPVLSRRRQAGPCSEAVKAPSQGAYPPLEPTDSVRARPGESPETPWKASLALDRAPGHLLDDVRSCGLVGRMSPTTLNPGSIPADPVNRP